MREHLDVWRKGFQRIAGFSLMLLLGGGRSKQCQAREQKFHSEMLSKAGADGGQTKFTV
jgi:hypothetical protein